MGAEIFGIGTENIKIIGKKKLYGTKYKVLPDRIEAGTYMIAAAATKGNLKIKGISYDLVENLAKIMQEIGIEIIKGDNFIRIKHKGKINPINI